MRVNQDVKTERGGKKSKKIKKKVKLERKVKIYTGECVE